MTIVSAKVDYGIDAPGWFVGTASAGTAALALAFLARGSHVAGGRGHASSDLAGHRLDRLRGRAHLVEQGREIREERRLLDVMPWRGDERVLDVGCGHGLTLVESARRLHSGRAVGVYIWSDKDQWRNRPEATPANAVAAGVANRVEVEEADARSLPFPDASFDVVLSTFVVHIEGLTARKPG